MASKKILVISEDVQGAYTIKELLGTKEYDFVFAYDKQKGIEKARLERPDLILLDADSPDVYGFTVSGKLKEDATTRFIPIIALVDLIDTLSGKVSSLESEAYLLKPFNTSDLTKEIERLLKRTVEQLSANPLTKLPGSVSIEKNVTDRLQRGDKFAVCYLDFDNFKPYNDYYGFQKGDDVIKLLAQILIESCREKGNENDFIGHIGGDDFIFVTTPDKVDDVCSGVIKKFDGERHNFYNEEDIKRGYITTKDRQFRLHNFPLMTVSISVVTNELRDITHYGKIVDILVEMKKFVKSRDDKTQSAFMKDRRKGDF